MPIHCQASRVHDAREEVRDFLELWTDVVDAGTEQSRVTVLNQLLARVATSPSITDHDGSGWHLHYRDADAGFARHAGRRHECRGRPLPHRTRDAPYPAVRPRRMRLGIRRLHLTGYTKYCRSRLRESRCRPAAPCRVCPQYLVASLKRPRRTRQHRLTVRGRPTSASKHDAYMSDATSTSVGELWGESSSAVPVDGVAMTAVGVAVIRVREANVRTPCTWIPWRSRCRRCARKEFSGPALGVAGRTRRSVLPRGAHVSSSWSVIVSAMRWIPAIKADRDAQERVWTPGPFGCGITLLT